MDLTIWAEFQQGTRVDLVVESLVLECGDHHIMRVLGTGSTLKVVGLPDKGAASWTILGALVQSVDDGFPSIVIDDQSTVFPHYVVTLGNFGRCIELCAGAGFMSTGARAAGLETIAGFEQNSKFEQFFVANGGHNFCCLNIHDSECVKQAFRLEGQGALVLSGIACQPYSRAGDEKGGCDGRAGTLPATLKFAWLIQAPVIILECTPKAMTNEFVQGQIKSFATRAGYHVSQQVLHLDRQWVGRRDRWWCVLSARPLGQVQFQDLPEAKDCRVVADVMPTPCAWPETELAALELTLYEHHKIHCCSTGLESLLINPQMPLPTALHSWGNQCYGCACGCRKAFSEKRLNERGVFAVLVAMGDSIKHEGFVFPRCRHLHPSEVTLLSGARLTRWDGCMRLGLAAAGQMASPLQAVWVCSHVMEQISKFSHVPTIASPHECLANLRNAVLQDCQLLWPGKSQIPRSIPERPAPDEAPYDSKVDEPSASPGSFTIELGHFPSLVVLPIQVTQGCFVQSLVRADASFWDCPVESLVCMDETGQILPDLSVLTPNMKVWIGVQSEISSCHEVSKVDATAKVSPPFTDADFPPRDLDLPLDLQASQESGKSQVRQGHLGGLPVPVDKLMTDASDGAKDCLSKLTSKGLLEMVVPQVYSSTALCGLRSQMMSRTDRIQILGNQEDSWGDDEIRFHLNRVAMSAAALQAVIVWDPLMTTSLMKCLQGSLIEQAVASIPECATIITAAVVDGHWFPIVWRKEAGCLCGFSYGVPASFLLIVQNIHAWMCQRLQVPVTYFKSVDQPVSGFCGAVTISYVEHLIWATPMIGMVKTHQEVHAEYRHHFLQTMSQVTHRPWVWGKGQESIDPALLGLLRQHGVPSDEVVARAEHIMKHLGSEKVGKALQSPRPWQDLKHLANQNVPAYQLIRPSELQAVVDRRAHSDAPLGHKKQKSKGAGKGKSKGSELDPASLRIEEGTFTVGEGKPIAQLALGDIGPMAMGVVLATLDQALPFISQNRQVSMGGLAVVVLNVSEVPSGLPLISEPIRFPAVCAANAEPVLVQGLLFQLGNVPVRRAVTTDPVAMECIQTFVAKFVIFRDGVSDWESVVKQPVRYLLQHFQCLVPCREEDCAGSCHRWHSGKDIHIDDPVMSVWNRQWLKGNFVSCRPDDATMFVVSIRVPAELEQGLIAKSGAGSIVVEPRELDGRQVSKAYHVVWLAKQSFAQAQVLRQTTEGALGLARIGDKWGLRCRAELASRVHKALKPATEYLPSGAKMHYLIGPVPYGTIKQSVVQACKAIDWEIRPLFAVPAPRSVEGIMYKVQSVVCPPKQVISLQDGDAVITRCDQANAKVTSHVPVVGSSASVQLVHQPVQKSKPDSIWLNDPWASWSRPGSSDVSAASTRESVEQKVVDAVLARLPRDMTEGDQNMEGSDRVAALEAQVASLHEQQVELKQSLADHANTQTAQVVQLQSQFQAQHGQLEAAVAEQSRQLQGLGSQFQMQMEKQQSQLDTMFQSQMQRLEDLWCKRSRHE